MENAILLSIDTLHFSTKKRRGVSPRRVEELRRMLEEGMDLMPIRVNALGDGAYAVKDGRHRIEAHIAAGWTSIFAIVENLSSNIKRIVWSFFKKPHAVSFFKSGRTKNCVIP